MKSSSQPRVSVNGRDFRKAIGLRCYDHEVSHYDPFWESKNLKDAEVVTIEMFDVSSNLNLTKIKFKFLKGCLIPYNELQTELVIIRFMPTNLKRILTSG
ncbi:Hypothetical predicted protein [Octopus vulgaris]|uniref:Uncharacterized protein n=1 Tax=Octopus vulgaris TaxID=6645 RepID=A0AA36B8L5_OCTVU|nr:Hypothetical predicted protein [Octopus vulgaris]